MSSVFLPSQSAAHDQSWAQPGQAGTKKDKMMDDKIILKSFCRPLFCLLKSLPKK
jgi:hypothetical protein